jgi:hypothetical protein
MTARYLDNRTCAAHVVLLQKLRRFEFRFAHSLPACFCPSAPVCLACELKPPLGVLKHMYRGALHAPLLV